MRLYPLLVLVVLFSGCVQPDGSADRSQAPIVPDDVEPVVDVRLASICTTPGWTTNSAGACSMYLQPENVVRDYPGDASIAVNPDDPNELLVATTYSAVGAGLQDGQTLSRPSNTANYVWHSTDGGASWTPLDVPFVALFVGQQDPDYSTDGLIVSFVQGDPVAIAGVAYFPLQGPSGEHGGIVYARFDDGRWEGATYDRRPAFALPPYDVFHHDGRVHVLFSEVFAGRGLEWGIVNGTAIDSVVNIPCPTRDPSDNDGMHRHDMHAFGTDRLICPHNGRIYDADRNMTDAALETDCRMNRFIPVGPGYAQFPVAGHPCEQNVTFGGLDRSPEPLSDYFGFPGRSVDVESVVPGPNGSALVIGKVRPTARLENAHAFDEMRPFAAVIVANGTVSDARPLIGDGETVEDPSSVTPYETGRCNAAYGHDKVWVACSEHEFGNVAVFQADVVVG